MKRISQNSVVEFGFLLIVSVVVFGVMIYYGIPLLYQFLGAENFIRGSSDDTKFDMQSYSGFFQAWTGIAIALAGSYAAIKIAQRSHELSSALALSEKKGELQSIFSEANAIFHAFAKSIREFEAAAQIILAETAKLAKKDLDSTLRDEDKIGVENSIREWLVPAARNLRESYSLIISNPRYKRILGDVLDKGVVHKIYNVENLKKTINDSNALESILNGNILSALDLLVQRAVSVTPNELLIAYHQRILWRCGENFLSYFSVKDYENSVELFVKGAYEVSSDLSDIKEIWFYDVCAVRVIGAALLKFSANLPVGGTPRSMQVNLGMAIFSDLCLSMPDLNIIKEELFSRDPDVIELKEVLREIGLTEQDIFLELPGFNSVSEFGNAEKNSSGISLNPAVNISGQVGNLSGYFSKVFQDEMRGVNDNAVNFTSRHCLLVPVSSRGGSFVEHVRTSCADWVASYVCDRIIDQNWGDDGSVEYADLLGRLKYLYSELTESERTNWNGVRLQVTIANIEMLCNPERGLATVQGAFHQALDSILKFSRDFRNEFINLNVMYSTSVDSFNSQTIILSYWMINLLSVQKLRFSFCGEPIVGNEVAGPIGFLPLILTSVVSSSLKKHSITYSMRECESFLGKVADIGVALSAFAMYDICFELNAWAQSSKNDEGAIILDSFFS